MIDLYVLNEDLEIIGIVDCYSSLIWANRYDKDGDCEIYIEANKENVELLKQDYYLIRTDDDNMACKIKYVETDTNAENGDYLTVKGYDVKDKLSQRIVWKQTNINGKAEDCIYNLVDKNFINTEIQDRKFQNKNGKTKLLLDNKQGFTETMTGQTSHKNIEEKIQEICKKFGWGYKIKVKDENFYFSLYKGEDRSDKVVFSSDFENLQSTKYTSDKTNIKNVALIGGEGEGSKRSKEVAGQGIGSDRYETFVDAKDISKSITFEELTKMYPTTEKGGQGNIETLGDIVIYKMNYIDIEIIDDNQLLRLEEQYPSGEEIGNKYYRIHNVAIAELENSTPEDGSNVVLKDIVYSTYLLNRGYEKLSEYRAKETFEGEIEPSTTFEYKKDYFLGDIVTVRNEYGIEKKVRITEIIEVEDENGYSVQPKFEYMEDK